MESIIIWIICGAIAGFIASKLVKGSGSGLLIDLILGVIGAIVGSWLFGLLHINISLPFYLGDIITAAVGAIIVIWIGKLIKK